MDSELDRTLDPYARNEEFEAFLDEMRDEEVEQEPACECFYVDVDLVDNRNCPAHGRF